MSTTETPQTTPKTFAEKMQSIDRRILYVLLLLCTTIPFFMPFPVPNKPVEPTEDLFQAVSELPEGSVVLLQSDWTFSTRGESQGQFEGMLNLLMDRKLKFVVYSVTSPQAAEIAKDTVRLVNEKRAEAGKNTYKRWDDWVSVGYFPDPNSTLITMSTDLRKAFAGRMDKPPGGTEADIFQSPVLRDVNKIEDVSLVIITTASATISAAIERLSGKVPLAGQVTGVMGPETQVYYDTRQLVGLSSGLKGVYDLETLMKTGLKKDGVQIIEPTPGDNSGKGTAYYPALHTALGLMILAIFIGNIGMLISRRQGGK